MLGRFKDRVQYDDRAPTGRTIRPDHVVASLPAGLTLLSSNLELPPKAATNRHGPAVIAVGFPVSHDATAVRLVMKNQSLTA